MLLDDPVGILRAYCVAMDLPFTPDSLEWQPSERDEVGWYDDGSWHAHLRQSTGLQRIDTEYAPIDSDPWLAEAYAACVPHYDHIWQHRLPTG